MDIVEQMRSFESDHEPDGWPAIQMKQVSALCDEVERLNSELNTLQAGINCTGYSVDQAVANFKYWIAEHDRSQSLLNGMASEVERLQSLLEQERKKSLTSSCRVAALEMELDRLLQSPRITEQDAREIALSAWRYWMNNCDRTVDNWIEDEGLDLTNKLNGVTNETN